MNLQFKNTEIFYSTKGIGNPIVFLHGFLESSEIWEPYVADLSQNRQVICIDLPGHGLSGIIASVHSMELMADVVQEVLRELKIPLVTMVGHSMGGYVILAFCEKYPDMIHSLVLMNSTPEEDSPERKQNRDRSINLVQRNKTAFVNMAINNLLTSENNLKFRREIDALKNRAATFSSGGIIAALEGMKIRTSKIEKLKSFSGNKLMISGEKDLILNHKHLISLAFKCKSNIITLPDGHLSYLENIPEVHKILHFVD